MEFVGIEKQLFEELVRKFEYFETLQTLRDNGTLPFSQINHKIFYKPEDVQGIVKKVEDRRKEALYRSRNI